MLHCTKKPAMNPQLDASIDRIRHRARGRYRQLLDSARSRTEQAAGRIGGGKKPLHTLSNLGIKLSGVSHRTTDTLLKHNTRLLENQLDVIAMTLAFCASRCRQRAAPCDQAWFLPRCAV